MRRLVLFCDESVLDGPYYSNFFGAAMVEEKRLEHVNAILKAKLVALNIHKEVKFQRITPSYQAKYQELMVEFFRLIRSGDVKIRIMFTQNINQAVLTLDERKRNGYFLLYYQLIKHSFGWQYMPEAGPLTVLLNFDQFPHTREDVAQFKRYLCRLTHQSEFRAKGIKIFAHNIAEVDSSKHPILQCLDVIIGSVQCRLNNGHKQKAPGSRFISKRAKAKEALYKTIREEIGKLYPGYQFNVGETTAHANEGSGGDYFLARWTAPYRHWKFVPKRTERNTSYVAKNK